MILNIVNKNVRSHAALSDCLAQLGSGDAVLLIEDGVYAAIDTHTNRDWLAQCPNDAAVYVLMDDAAARGVQDSLLSAIQPVDYRGFVDLVTRYSLSQSWF